MKATAVMALGVVTVAAGCGASPFVVELPSAGEEIVVQASEIVYITNRSGEPLTLGVNRTGQGTSVYAARTARPTVEDRTMRPLEGEIALQPDETVAMVVAATTDHYQGQPLSDFEITMEVSAASVDPVSL